MMAVLIYQFKIVLGRNLLNADSTISLYRRYGQLHLRLISVYESGPNLYRLIKASLLHFKWVLQLVTSSLGLVAASNRETWLLLMVTINGWLSHLFILHWFTLWLCDCRSGERVFQLLLLPPLDMRLNVRLQIEASCRPRLTDFIYRTVVPNLILTQISLQCLIVLGTEFLFQRALPNRGGGSRRLQFGRQLIWLHGVLRCQHHWTFHVAVAHLVCEFASTVTVHLWGDASQSLVSRNIWKEAAMLGRVLQLHVLAIVVATVIHLILILIIKRLARLPFLLAVWGRWVLLLRLAAIISFQIWVAFAQFPLLPLPFCICYLRQWHYRRLVPNSVHIHMRPPPLLVPIRHIGCDYRAALRAPVKLNFVFGNCLVANVAHVLWWSITTHIFISNLIFRRFI